MISGVLLNPFKTIICAIFYGRPFRITCSSFVLTLVVDKFTIDCKNHDYMHSAMLWARYACILAINT